MRVEFGADEEGVHHHGANLVRVEELDLRVPAVKYASDDVTHGRPGDVTSYRTDDVELCGCVLYKERENEQKNVASAERT